MKDNFASCLRLTLTYEGGYVDDPRDPGGATNFGITLATYSNWLGHQATKGQLRTIQSAVVEAIYRQKYWDAVRGDDLPAGLDLVAFDGAVNSGPSRGAKWLQAGLGVTADGAIGPLTLAAAAKADRAEVVRAACDARLHFLQNLSTWKTFGRGWAARVAKVRTAALAMVA